jgi:predicted nucleotidyltransferase
MPLRPEDVRTLEILSRVLRGEGWTFVVIGAAVPWILATQSTGLRGTRDIDVVVNTASWDDFDRAGSRLRDAGFTRHHLHEFTSPHGTRIDLLPYGQELVRGDTIAWPDGMTMSALGLAETFDSAVERRITEALSVHVATEAAFALLKVVAYMDRPAARSKDLGDLIDAFTRYEEESDRRFELFDVSVDSVPLQFEEAGAYLLGTDAAALAARKTRSVIQAFLAGLTDEYSRPIGQALMEEKRTGNDERRAEVWRLFRVFREGFERH